MNQFYRALHMPPARLLKKLTGHKEIYTIALRFLHGDTERSLPALGQGVYTPLPYDAAHWYADPLLFCKDGVRVLFCEEFDRATGKGRIAVCTVEDDGQFGPMQPALEEEFHLSFPLVFEWNGGLFMLPETSTDHSLILYRCEAFPAVWQRAARFETGCELCDTILLENTPDSLTLLCSETNPKNQLYTRWRRYTLHRNAAPKSDEKAFSLQEDTDFAAAHSEFDLGSRNAGPLFDWGGQQIHPTQVSTTVDYGVYLQFFVRRGEAEKPLCAASPARVEIAGLPTQDIVGIHTYCRDDAFEVIDARYLHKD